MLNYNFELVAKYMDQGVEVGDQGIDGSFELVKQIHDKVVTAHFVGDCFIYTTDTKRLNYCVGGEVTYQDGDGDGVGTYTHTHMHIVMFFTDHILTVNVFLFYR